MSDMDYQGRWVATLPAESLDQEIRVSVVEFRGSTRILIRLWLREGSKWVPHNRAGLRFSLKDVPNLVRAVHAAEKIGSVPA